MQYRRYRSDQLVITGTDDNQVTLRKVPVGVVLEVTHFTCADRDTANKLMELGYVDQSGVNHPVAAEQQAQNKHLKMMGEIWIEEGESPYGKVYSPTDADDFLVSCHGRLWPKEPEVIVGAQIQPEDSLSD